MKHAHNFRDLTGQTFNRLTVTGGKTQWTCQCSCGNVTNVSTSNLTTGHVRSCGCYIREIAGKHAITHGESRNRKPSREFRSYHSAKERCTNPNQARFKDYGGRGIEFRFTSVEQFLDCVGRCPTSKHTLDRIDVDGHYEPGNVRWATQQEQQNNRRNNLHCLARLSNSAASSAFVLSM